MAPQFSRCLTENLTFWSLNLTSKMIMMVNNLKGIIGSNEINEEVLCKQVKSWGYSMCLFQNTYLANIRFLHLLITFIWQKKWNKEFITKWVLLLETQEGKYPSGMNSHYKVTLLDPKAHLPLRRNLEVTSGQKGLDYNLLTENMTYST